jgi:hypothetical protein
LGKKRKRFFPPEKGRQFMSLNNLSEAFSAAQGASDNEGERQDEKMLMTGHLFSAFSRA